MGTIYKRTNNTEEKLPKEALEEELINGTSYYQISAKYLLSIQTIKKLIIKYGLEGIKPPRQYHQNRITDGGYLLLYRPDFPGSYQKGHNKG